MPDPSRDAVLQDLEVEKLRAEIAKLQAETAKLTLERFLYPMVVLTGLMLAGLGVAKLLV